MRTELLDAYVLGLSYDLAVLQANDTPDRCLRGRAALGIFDKEAEENIEVIRRAWHAAAKRLGLGEKTTSPRRGQTPKELASQINAIFSSLLTNTAVSPRRR
jgi:hypothetical protein